MRSLFFAVIMLALAHIAGAQSVWSDRPVIALWAASAAVQILDYRATRSYVLEGSRELNPLVRPFVHSPALYVEGQAELALIAFLGHRMRGSRHPFVRRLWWVPQTFQFEENTRCWAFGSHKRLFLLTKQK
jgi:hypothetical protein